MLGSASGNGLQDDAVLQKVNLSDAATNVRLLPEQINHPVSVPLRTDRDHVFEYELIAVRRCQKDF